MVDVFRIRPFTDEAHAALIGHHPIEVVGTDAVSPLQVIVAAASIEALSRLGGARVVARLAVGVSSVFGVPVPRELLERLGEPAVGTAFRHATMMEQG